MWCTDQSRQKLTDEEGSFRGKRQGTQSWTVPVGILEVSPSFLLSSVRHKIMIKLMSGG